MICRIQVQKIIKYSFALAFVIGGIVVLGVIGTTLPAIGIAVVMIGGGIAVANATLLEDDMRYRRHYV